MAEHAAYFPAFLDEASLIEALCLGNETAFVALVEQYHVLMIHLALPYVAEWSVAEEVAQEAWLGVLRGIATFEGRSSLKTWIMRILVNQAKSRARRDGRSVPFSAMWPADVTLVEPSVAAERFQESGPDREHWTSAPQDWSVLAEEQLLSEEMRGVVDHTIALLPEAHRTVLILHDIHGWSAAEVCQLLGISPSNQRVILHRARSKVRQALERYLGED